MDMTADEFAEKMNTSKARLKNMFTDSVLLEKEILTSLEELSYE